MYFMFHVFLVVPAKMIFEGTSQIGRRLKIGLFCMKWCLLMLSISSGYPELIVDILGWRGICIYAKFQFRASSSTTQHTPTTQVYIKRAHFPKKDQTLHHSPHCDPFHPSVVLSSTTKAAFVSPSSLWHRIVGLWGNFVNNEFIIQDKAYLTHKCASVGFVMFRTRTKNISSQSFRYVAGFGWGWGWWVEGEEQMSQFCSWKRGLMAAS